MQGIGKNGIQAVMLNFGDDSGGEVVEHGQPHHGLALGANVRVLADARQEVGEAGAHIINGASSCQPSQQL